MAPQVSEEIPKDAEVFAVCDGAMTIRQHDHPPLRPLSDQEKSALEELIVESQQREAKGTTERQGRLVSRLLRRLLNI